MELAGKNTAIARPASTSWNPNDKPIQVICKTIDSELTKLGILRAHELQHQLIFSPSKLSSHLQCLEPKLGCHRPYWSGGIRADVSTPSVRKFNQLSKASVHLLVCDTFYRWQMQGLT
jgi:hypothetical protein